MNTLTNSGADDSVRFSWHFGISTSFPDLSRVIGDGIESFEQDCGSWAVKKKQVAYKKALQPVAKVYSDHPFVGTWEEDPTTDTRTTVIYTVSVQQGRFRVAGRDGEDGNVLKISQVKWDGDSLRFTSFYPPGHHKAQHVLRLRSNGKMSHEVSGTYLDGEAFSELEVWTHKRRTKKPNR